MNKITDEVLSAYIDGELSPNETAQLKAALERKPALMARFEALQAGTAQLRPAFSDLANEPVPERFTRMLAEPSTRGPRLFDRFRALMRPAILVPSAASLIAGFVLATLVSGPGQNPAGFQVTESGTVIANVGLASVLQSARSGAVFDQGGAPVLVRLSISTEDNRYCRQFYIADKEGIACTADEGWTLDLLVPARANVFADGYRLAQGETSPAIDAAIQRLNIRRVLDDEVEAAVIKAQWKTPTSE